MFFRRMPISNIRAVETAADFRHRGVCENQAERGNALHVKAYQGASEMEQSSCFNVFCFVVRTTIMLYYVATICTAYSMFSKLPPAEYPDPPPPTHPRAAA